MAGQSYPQIASLLQCSVSTAYKRVMGSLKETLREPSDEVRKLELARLDALYWSVYPEALKGRYGAVDRCIRIMERRSRLLGLDSPLAISVDWRKEAEEAGLKASDVFEALVAQAMADNAKRLGELPSGEPDGG
jgi:hypothetical protein